jgi:SRSO17 transposase
MTRWRLELDYRELKEELGLGHYEGRHWLEWHHHACLVSVAYALLRSEQARGKKTVWCDLASREEAPTSLADEACGLVSLVPYPVRRFMLVSNLTEYY